MALDRTGLFTPDQQRAYAERRQLLAGQRICGTPRHAKCPGVVHELLLPLPWHSAETSLFADSIVELQRRRLLPIAGLHCRLEPPCVLLTGGSIVCDGPLPLSGPIEKGGTSS